MAGPRSLLSRQTLRILRADMVILARTLRQQGSAYALTVLLTPTLIPTALCANEFEATHSKIIPKPLGMRILRLHSTKPPKQAALETLKLQAPRSNFIMDLGEIDDL